MITFEPDSADESGVPDSEVRQWQAGEAEHGLRLDKALVLHAPEFSRNHLQSLIERGCVRVQGQRVETASRKLRMGQSVEVQLLATAESSAFTPQAMPLDIRFEDDELLVINKPAGLVVHPAAGHWSGTLLNGLLAHHPAAQTLPRAGIVHRLDKDTSGLMVVAKTLGCMNALVQAIAARSVQRIYWALAHGHVQPTEQLIDAPISRDAAHRIRMAVVASGKPAQTTVRVLGSNGLVSAVECTLHTGRTHQIRVHMAHIGHPLLADSVYGGKAALGLLRQALHARRLSFVHPVTLQPLSFVQPLPLDLQSAWEALGMPLDPTEGTGLGAG